MKGVSGLLLLSLFVYTLGAPHGNTEWKTTSTSAQEYKPNDEGHSLSKHETTDSVESSEESNSDDLSRRVNYSRLHKIRQRGSRHERKETDVRETGDSSTSSSVKEKHGELNIQLNHGISKQSTSSDEKSKVVDLKSKIEIQKSVVSDRLNSRFEKSHTFNKTISIVSEKSKGTVNQKTDSDKHLSVDKQLTISKNVSIVKSKSSDDQGKKATLNIEKTIHTANSVSKSDEQRVKNNTKNVTLSTSILNTVSKGNRSPGSNDDKTQNTLQGNLNIASQSHIVSTASNGNESTKNGNAVTINHQTSVSTSNSDERPSIIGSILSGVGNTLSQIISHRRNEDNTKETDKSNKHEVTSVSQQSTHNSANSENVSTLNKHIGLNINLGSTKSEQSSNSHVVKNEQESSVTTSVSGGSTHSSANTENVSTLNKHIGLNINLGNTKSEQSSNSHVVKNEQESSVTTSVSGGSTHSSAHTGNVSTLNKHIGLNISLGSAKSEQSSNSHIVKNEQKSSITTSVSGGSTHSSANTENVSTLNKHIGLNISLGSAKSEQSSNSQVVKNEQESSVTTSVSGGSTHSSANTENVSTLNKHIGLNINLGNTKSEQSSNSHVVKNEQESSVTTSVSGGSTHSSAHTGNVSTLNKHIGLNINLGNTKSEQSSNSHVVKNEQESSVTTSVSGGSTHSSANTENVSTLEKHVGLNINLGSVKSNSNNNVIVSNLAESGVKVTDNLITHNVKEISSNVNKEKNVEVGSTVQITNNHVTNERNNNLQLGLGITTTLDKNSIATNTVTSGTSQESKNTIAANGNLNINLSTNKLLQGGIISSILTKKPITTVTSVLPNLEVKGQISISKETNANKNVVNAVADLGVKGTINSSSTVAINGELNKNSVTTTDAHINHQTSVSTSNLVERPSIIGSILVGVDKTISKIISGSHDNGASKVTDKSTTHETTVGLNLESKKGTTDNKVVVSLNQTSGVEVNHTNSNHSQNSHASSVTTSVSKETTHNSAKTENGSILEKHVGLNINLGSTKSEQSSNSHIVKNEQKSSITTIVSGQSSHTSTKSENVSTLEKHVGLDVNLGTIKSNSNNNIVVSNVAESGLKVTGNLITQKGNEILTNINKEKNVDVGSTLQITKKHDANLHNNNLQLGLGISGSLNKTTNIGNIITSSTSHESKNTIAANGNLNINLSTNKLLQGGIISSILTKKPITTVTSVLPNLEVKGQISISKETNANKNVVNAVADLGVKGTINSSSTVAINGELNKNSVTTTDAHINHQTSVSTSNLVERPSIIGSILVGVDKTISKIISGSHDNGASKVTDKSTTHETTVGLNLESNKGTKENKVVVSLNQTSGVEVNHTNSNHSQNSHATSVTTSVSEETTHNSAKTENGSILEKHVGLNINLGSTKSEQNSNSHVVKNEQESSVTTSVSGGSTHSSANTENVSTLNKHIGLNINLGSTKSEQNSNSHVVKNEQESSVTTSVSGGSTHSSANTENVSTLNKHIGLNISLGSAKSEQSSNSQVVKNEQESSVTTSVSGGSTHGSANTENVSTLNKHIGLNISLGSAKSEQSSNSQVVKNEQESSVTTSVSGGSTHGSANTENVSTLNKHIGLNINLGNIKSEQSSNSHVVKNEQESSVTTSVSGGSTHSSANTENVSTLNKHIGLNINLGSTKSEQSSNSHSVKTEKESTLTTSVSRESTHNSVNTENVSTLDKHVGLNINLGSTKSEQSSNSHVAKNEQESSVTTTVSGHGSHNSTKSENVSTLEKHVGLNVNLGSIKSNSNNNVVSNVAESGLKVTGSLITQKVKEISTNVNKEKKIDVGSTLQITNKHGKNGHSNNIQLGLGISANLNKTTIAANSGTSSISKGSKNITANANLNVGLLAHKNTHGSIISSILNKKPIPVLPPALQNTHGGGQVNVVKESITNKTMISNNTNTVNSGTINGEKNQTSVLTNNVHVNVVISNKKQKPGNVVTHQTSTSASVSTLKYEQAINQVLAEIRKKNEELSSLLRLIISVSKHSCKPGLSSVSTTELVKKLNATKILYRSNIDVLSEEVVDDITTNALERIYQLL